MGPPSRRAAGVGEVEEEVEVVVEEVVVEVVVEVGCWTPSRSHSVCLARGCPWAQRVLLIAPACRVAAVPSALVVGVQAVGHAYPRRGRRSWLVGCHGHPHPSVAPCLPVAPLPHPPWK